MEDKPASKWKLTQQVIDQAEVDVWTATGDEVPGLGLMDLIASQPGSGVRKVDDGVYLVEKMPEPDPDDQFLSKKEPPANGQMIDVLDLMLGHSDGRDGVKRLGDGIWSVPPGWV